MGHQRRFADHYAKRAKREGKAARSIYKLEEIDARWHIFRHGQRVLDLGCAPGSWMQYAAERVGPRGFVLGYDLNPVSITLPKNAEARVGDAFALDARAEGSFDVVTSDMAPSTMGDHTTDALRSAALVERAVDVVELVLKPGGAAVFKLLEGKDVVDIVARLRGMFARVERLRPKATRSRSTELFIIGLDRRPGSPVETPE